MVIDLTQTIEEEIDHDLLELFNKTYNVKDEEGLSDLARDFMEKYPSTNFKEFIQNNFSKAKIISGREYAKIRFLKSKKEHYPILEHLGLGQLTKKLKLELAGLFNLKKEYTHNDLVLFTTENLYDKHKNIVYWYVFYKTHFNGKEKVKGEDVLNELRNKKSKKSDDMYNFLYQLLEEN